MQALKIPAPFHRHMPSRSKDGVVRHWIEARVGDLVEAFPDEPNPRDPNIDRVLYRKIRASLVDPDDVGHTQGAFGYRHSGLTLIAQSVEVSDGEATIRFGPNGGLVNGGHSHALIREVLAEGLTPEEYVMLEILIGVDDYLIPEIAEGRNTSLEVKRFSLADLAGSFDRLKGVLGSDADEIIWHEGDDGSLRAEHLIAMVSTFDPEAYSATRHPNDVYRKVTDKIDLLREDPDRFYRLSPIIPDVVRLFHTITYEAADLWEGVSEGASHGKVTGLPFLDHPKTPRSIPLYDSNAGAAAAHPMKYAAALVVTAAFRYLTEVDEDGPEYGEYRGVRWRRDADEPFEMWRKHAPVLMRSFYSQLTQAGRNLNGCVRSDAVWAAIYNQLVVVDVTS